MEQYISKAALVAEIEKLMYAANLEADIASTGECFNEEVANAKYKLCKQIKEEIDTLEVKEVIECKQPEYSCFETTYKCGKKPHWNVGDTLAYYEFCSDREGERVLGKVANVRFDEEQSDWIYTLEDGCLYEEKLLLEDETYKKN